MLSASIPRDQKQLHKDVRSLGQILDETSSSESTWSVQDYGAILQHQLDAPLGADLAHFFVHSKETLSGIPIRTFGELLLHPHPPLPALQLVKDFAKQLIQNAQLAYPRPVATILYYASIAAARTRTATWISELPQKELMKGLRWARKQVWVSAKLRPLFEEAMAAAGIRSAS